jgi:hypothetical protein
MSATEDSAWLEYQLERGAYVEGDTLFYDMDETHPCNGFQKKMSNACLLETGYLPVFVNWEFEPSLLPSPERKIIFRINKERGLVKLFIQLEQESKQQFPVEWLNEYFNEYWTARSPRGKCREKPAARPFNIQTTTAELTCWVTDFGPIITLLGVLGTRFTMEPGWRGFDDTEESGE